MSKKVSLSESRGSNDIVDILLAAKKAGVSSLKMGKSGELEVLFGESREVVKSHPVYLPVEKVSSESDVGSIHRETEEQEMENLLLTDPVEYERLQVGGGEEYGASRV